MWEHVAGLRQGWGKSPVTTVGLIFMSQRSAQVETALARAVSVWVDDHDGAKPDPRTLCRLERSAVLASRPGKSEPIEADQLRAEWAERAKHAGFAALALPDGQHHLPGVVGGDDEALITAALATVAASSSTWLKADLAREIAARLPAEAASSAVGVVHVIDELAERAAGRCVELHPPAASGAKHRRDGRPITEHVVDRRLSAPAVLDQEARLLAWAGTNVGAVRTTPDSEAQAVAARDVAGGDRLVLVVGPAGTGKTTMLASAVSSLRAQGREVVGLAPSGKAADVLGRETASPATTLAKLLHEHSRTEGPRPEWRRPTDTTLILDEAGLATTEDLARLVALADRHRWRLVCVGDPAQLPAVGRGGMFAHWCEAFPAHQLEEVRRFSEAWQGEASLLLRQGDPAAARQYGDHERLHTVHPALLADRVARQHHQLSAEGHTVAITTASTGTARAINVEIQRRRNPRQEGPSVALADGTRVFVGDQVATRRNDASVVAADGAAVRNRQTWTVTAIGEDGSLTLVDRQRGSVRLPKDYVARHLELGWAVTGYGNQGVTVDHGICVVEPASTRAGIYVAMTRGRGHNLAWVLDRTGLEDAEEVFAAAIARPPNARTAHAVRDQLYQAAGTTPPATVPKPEALPEDPARRMAERLKQLSTRRPPARRLGR
ncbi:MAG: AAA family ATPase [Acidimicrobiales bacterium]